MQKARQKPQLFDRGRGEKLTIPGLDNYKKPRQYFADKMAPMTNSEFVQFASECIWLSAYASNNPRSDYHWQADACYEEAERRGDPDLYGAAHRKASAR
jgi:hypothetical protein